MQKIFFFVSCGEDGFIRAYVSGYDALIENFFYMDNNKRYGNTQYF